MAAGSPTMRRRRLARELVRLREERGMTIRQAAGALEWDPSKLSRVEGLQRGIIVRDVRRLLALYQVTGDADREALFELAREAKQRGWWQAYADVMPSEYADLIGLEAEADPCADLLREIDEIAVPRRARDRQMQRLVGRARGLAIVVGVAFGCQVAVDMAAAYPAAVDRLVAACRDHGKPAGVLAASVETAEAWRARGFRIFAYGTDISLLQQSLRSGLARLRASERR